MPKRDAFFADMRTPDAHAVLLFAQVGAMPSELQLIVEVSQLDSAKQALRPLRAYLVRVLGVLEHRIVNLGITTQHVELVEKHPLTQVYNERPAALFFRGQPRDPYALTLDVAQAHHAVMGAWRAFPEYLDVSQPLATRFASGGGLLGQMPTPLAEALKPVLESYGLETLVQYGEDPALRHDSPLRDQRVQALFIGESFFLSYAFSFEEMAQRKRSPKGG